MASKITTVKETIIPKVAELKKVCLNFQTKIFLNIYSYYLKYFEKDFCFSLLFSSGADYIQENLIETKQLKYS